MNWFLTRAAITSESTAVDRPICEHKIAHPVTIQQHITRPHSLTQSCLEVRLRPAHHALPSTATVCAQSITIHCSRALCMSVGISIGTSVQLLGILVGPELGNVLLDHFVDSCL